MRENVGFEAAKTNEHPKYDLAKRMLQAAFPEQDDAVLDQLLGNLKEGALDTIDDVATSPRPEQRRRNVNAWLKEWKKEEVEEAV